MSASLKVVTLARAVRAGLVECLDPIGVAVFLPPSPEGDYDRGGSAWVSKAESKGEIETLGASPDDHTETVSIVATLSCYAETSDGKAYEKAEDRVVEMVDAFREWLGENPHLGAGAPCDWFVVSDAKFAPFAADKGWGLDAEITLVATVEPSAI